MPRRYVSAPRAASGLARSPLNRREDQRCPRSNRTLLLRCRTDRYGRAVQACRAEITNTHGKRFIWSGLASPLRSRYAGRARNMYARSRLKSTQGLASIWPRATISRPAPTEVTCTKSSGTGEGVASAARSRSSRFGASPGRLRRIPTGLGSVITRVHAFAQPGRKVPTAYSSATLCLSNRIAAP